MRVAAESTNLSSQDYEVECVETDLLAPAEQERMTSDSPDHWFHLSLIRSSRPTFEATSMLAACIVLSCQNVSANQI